MFIYLKIILFPGWLVLTLSGPVIAIGQDAGSRNNAGNTVIGDGCTAYNKGTITSALSWINHGAFTDTTGTVIFSDGLHTLDGQHQTTFHNLSVTSTCTLTSGGAGQNIRKVLKVDGTLNSDGHLTLLSGPASTALIDGSGIGTVNGPVNIQRYMEDAFGYTYFCSPFNQATVNEFSDEIDLDAAFSCFYMYEENKVSSGWTDYSDPFGILNPLEGYALNFGATHSIMTADASGIVNNGEILRTIYNHNQPYTQGFNLAGNPYPSPVDWDAATGWTRLNLDDAIYFFNASDTDRYTGSYSSYVNGVSSDGLADNIIATMQGFFVHVTTGSYPVTGVLGCTNAVRTKDPAPLFHLKSDEAGYPYARFICGFDEPGAGMDPLVIYFTDEASPAFDPDADALKLMNTDTSIPSWYALASHDEKLSIDGLSSVSFEDMIPTGIRTDREGYVVFRLSLLQGVPSGLQTYLLDARSGRYHHLSQTDTYRVWLPAGFMEGRFYLKLSSGEPTADPASPVPMQLYFSEGRIHVVSRLIARESARLSISSIAGQVLKIIEVNPEETYTIDDHWPPGVYVAILNHSKGFYSQKIVIPGR